MSWITGREILERPGWESEQDLIDAYAEWGLSPYRQIGRARMTRNSKCFNCTRANKDYMPGRIDEHGGPCLPLQWPSLRQDSGGLRIPRFAPSYARAKELDPELAEHFFQGGEFTLDAGCISITSDRLLRFLTAMVGPDVVERMVLENVCDRHEPMSPLDMGDRLLAAKFRLSDVEAFEDRHGIGQAEEAQLEEAVEEWPDNPLALGKAMKDRKVDPMECIRIMEQRHPELKPDKVGAYARGIEPDETNKGSCRKWYYNHREKPE